MRLAALKTEILPEMKRVVEIESFFGTANVGPLYATLHTPLFGEKWTVKKGKRVVKSHH